MTAPTLPERVRGRVDQDLVYDIGLHVGTDTAYYLRKGYRVVAIEANPLLAAQAREQFAAEIADGRLTVLNIGIGETAGEAEFWVCDDWSAWSSFDREVASRDGKRHHAEAVEVVPMSTVVAEHGLPFYCKVDIEGNDHFVLDGLKEDAKPDFLSVELYDHPFIDRMHDLGYDRFKLIHQHSFASPTPQWLRRRSKLPDPRARAGVERLRGLARGTLLDGRWYFRIGSSGPLAFDTPGPWVDADAIRELREWLRSERQAGRLTLLDAFDLAATTRETLDAAG
jgi:FkbM family methyltransferase